jgi:alanine racemase
MLNTTRAVIDLDALRHNLAVVRSLCPASRVMAMVKADAYGHGLLPVAQALAAAGVDGLAVARLSEALQLHDVGIDRRLLLLGSLLDDGDLDLCAERDIDVVVHDTITAERVRRHRGVPLRIWLKLDSGMHRLGLTVDEFRAADARLRGAAGVGEIVHMTHFSSAEEPDASRTERQLASFREAHHGSAAAVSLANSAGLIAHPETRGDWVRPGIMLYGDNPVAANQPLPLRPVMSLRAFVTGVRDLGPNESVGYNATWTSRRPSRIAAIGIGYGDGYPRHAGNGTPVWLNGKIVPLAGRVSMDTICVDVTELDSVAVGDEAVLWGAELPAALVARHAETISYELFTSIGSRVTREYLAVHRPAP